MRVLVLSSYPALLHPALDMAGDTYTDCKHEREWPWGQQYDYIVSFGYRHILQKPLLEEYKDRIVNIHISLLPWNRGSDPNFWSWFDDTPKGVSIHKIVPKLDGGDILAQRECINWMENETLNSSWYHLMGNAKELFEECWPSIRSGAMLAMPQMGGGSYHRSADKEQWLALMPLKWDTPVKDVTDLGRKYRLTLHPTGTVPMGGG